MGSVLYIAPVLVIAILLQSCDQGPENEVSAFARDSLALVSIYLDLNGLQWQNQTNWLSGPLHSWYGVTVSGDQRVIALELFNNRLSGPLPQALGDLTELNTLSLHHNTLIGPIPSQLERLTGLATLDLSHNNFAGEIPSFLSRMSMLEWLDLHHNELSGEIPRELADLVNLQILRLYENTLTGTLSPELGGLAKLEIFQIGFNELSGELPAELGQMSALAHLSLSSNGFTGALPGSLTGLKLETFSFEDTELCVPVDEAFQQWLAGVGNVLSSDISC